MSLMIVGRVQRILLFLLDGRSHRHGRITSSWDNFLSIVIVVVLVVE